MSMLVIEGCREYNEAEAAALREFINTKPVEPAKIRVYFVDRINLKILKEVDMVVVPTLDKGDDVYVEG